MANRFVLNETSYHGKGAIASIADEAIGRGFQKAFVCSDPDLLKFGVTKRLRTFSTAKGWLMKFIPTLKPTPPLKTASTAWTLSKPPARII